MSTNEFARILLTWIKSFLSWIGIPRDRLNELDEIIFLILIVVIAFAVGAVFHYLSVRFTRKVLKYKKYQFFKFADRIQCLAEKCLRSFRRLLYPLCCRLRSIIVLLGLLSVKKSLGFISLSLCCFRSMPC